MKTKPPRLPRIGPCRDPLALWFLEWAGAEGQRWRRYYANRADARLALRAFKAKADDKELEAEDADDQAPERAD